MKQTLIAFMFGCFSLIGHSEEILSAMESNEFILNVQSGTIHVMSVTEIAPIEFDTQWVSEDTNVVGRLLVNGIPKREFVGFGQLDWVPPTAGVYQVACEFYRDEERVGSSLNATFEVDPISIFFTPNTEVVSGAPFVVSMVCSDPAAVIHYTTDGSEPNSASPVYTEGVEFDRNVIVRAVGVVRDSFVGTTGSHQYVHAVPNPKITPSDGSTFALDSCEVSISVDLPNAVVYYTTNGSSPRLTDAYRYVGPFEISDSAKIRAVATFQTLKSSYVDASISKVSPVAPGVPIISPGDGFQFRGGACEVSIDSPCDGAVLYYTVDGSLPMQNPACLYTGPFVVSDTVTVRAIAVHDGIVSDCANAVLTKVVLDVQGTVGSQMVVATTGGAALFRPVWDATLDGVDATVRSGKMDSATTVEGNISWLELSVNGAGTLSFWWKVDCEHDDSGECTWDRGMYFVDDSQMAVASIDGKNGWTLV